MSQFHHFIRGRSSERDEGEAATSDGETDTSVVDFFSASRAAYEAIRFLIKFNFPFGLSS
jgi:hypothetical protein